MPAYLNFTDDQDNASLGPLTPRQENMAGAYVRNVGLVCVKCLLDPVFDTVDYEWMREEWVVNAKPNAILDSLQQKCASEWGEAHCARCSKVLVD